MATTKAKPISLFVPFTKIERRAEDGAMIVEGYCFVNPTVKGDRYSIQRAAMEAATPEYLKFPAVREMHQPIAAGTGLEVIWDDHGCLLRSECVDESTQRKIDKKVLRGYSVGVNPTSVNRADEVESLDWVETSYVDRPKDPDAVFLYRVEGYDPDADLTVEVLDAPPSSASPEGETPPLAAEPPPPSAAGVVEETASAPEDVTSSTPSGEEARGDASRIWQVVRGELAEDATEAEQREYLVATLAGLGVAEPIAREMAARVDLAAPAEERALTAEAVPVRENLEPRKPKMYDDARTDRTASGLAYSIEDAHYALMDSLYSILESDEDDKVGLIAKSAKQCAGHIEEMCKAKAERAAAVEAQPPAEKTREAGGSEPPPAGTTEGSHPAPPPISRESSREEPENLTRLETVTAELSRVRLAHEETLTRLATAEAEVQRLGNLPVEEKPVVRYTRGFPREFIANEELEGGDSVVVIRALYDKAVQAAATETDPGLKRQALNRVLIFKEGLRELGVTV
jgi:hypothetical protein